LPPATQGFVALEMLKILEGFDFNLIGQKNAEALHLVMRLRSLPSPTAIGIWRIEIL
jgi:gamma-glutamyltranspeptidase